MRSSISLLLLAVQQKLPKSRRHLDSLSPVKSGSMVAYKMTAAMRLVGFDSKKQEQLSLLLEEKESVTINNCQLKQSIFSDEIEIIITSTTKFAKSQKKFNITVEEASSSSASPITLDSVSKLQDFQNIIVRAKVLTLKEPLEVKPSLLKQDVIIADATGTVRLTVWQQDTNQLCIEKSYVFDKVTIRSYDGSK